MLAIIIDLRGKFATVIDNKLLGTSVHKDYSLFHFKAHDIKALKLPLTKFIYLKADAELDEVIDAEQLKERGCNYKTAKRNMDDLTDEQQIEVNAAYELVKASINPPVQEPTQEPAHDAVAPTVAEEPAASGEEPQATEEPVLQEPATPVDPEAALDADEPDEPETPDEPGDPLDTIKPSRKQKRR